MKKPPFIRLKGTENDALDHPAINICKTTHAKLKIIAEERLIPVSKLIAIAIDNELETERPFHFKTIIPEDPPYVEGEYMKEAVKIYNWMIRWFKGGLDVQQLLLCRRDIGIENVEAFLLGFRELIKKDMVVSAALTGPSAHTYPKGHKKWLIHPETRKYHEENQRKMDALKMQQIKEQGPLDEA